MLSVAERETTFMLSIMTTCRAFTTVLFFVRGAIEIPSIDWLILSSDYDKWN